MDWVTLLFWCKKLFNSKRGMHVKIEKPVEWNYFIFFFQVIIYFSNCLNKPMILKGNQIISLVFSKNSQWNYNSFDKMSVKSFPNFTCHNLITYISYTITEYWLICWYWTDHHCFVFISKLWSVSSHVTAVWNWDYATETVGRIQERGISLYELNCLMMHLNVHVTSANPFSSQMYFLPGTSYMPVFSNCHVMHGILPRKLWQSFAKQ